MTASNKQVTLAESTRQSELTSLRQRVTEIHETFAAANNAAAIIQHTNDFAAVQSAKAAACYRINSVLTLGNPRQQLNLLVTRWAAQPA